MRGTRRLLAVIVAAGVAAVVGTGPADAQAADVSATVRQHRLLIVSGARSARITLRLRAGHRQQLMVDADSDGDTDFRFDRRRFNSIVVNARNGNDLVRIDERNGAFTTVERTRILGGNGADTLIGGSGSERLIGGSGADSVVGGGGNDVVSLGDDDDVFRWKPGDGTDVVEGHAGTDTLRINGSRAGESFVLGTRGPLLRVARNTKSAMNAVGVERVELLPLGGSDTLFINDLSPTAVTALSVDLGPADGLVNHLILNGTNGDDVATVSGSVASGVTVSGLAAQVTVSNSAVTDVLHVDVHAGDDVVDASSLSAGALSLILDGGDGHDVLIGSAGPDTVFGGPGDDVLIGGPGVDVLDGGPGGNIIIQD